MLFSEAKNLKVVSASSAETVGKVSRFVVDPRTRAVVALELKKTESGDVLRWSDITGFGDDAVTVSSADRIGEADEEVAALADKRHRVLGKRVLTSGGDELGKLDDVDFDRQTGALGALVVSHGPQVAADRLLGIGSYAVVVREEA
jgi:sporulation protein YlmC with PRC-barrel domain